MEQVNSGLNALLAILALPALAALFFISAFIYRHTIGKRLKTTLREDYQQEAGRFEKAGKFVSAARVYETKLKDLKKAAALYEKGGDFRKASSLYDLLGTVHKAKEMYEKDGNIDDAAAVSIREGNFEEAAKLYHDAGKKIAEAVIMEQAGRTLPAIRAYREAGDYRNAARLLETEGMHRDAAEMFGLMLRGKPVDPSAIEDFYTYAVMLEGTAQADNALDIYLQIDSADPAYRDVREKIAALSPPFKENNDGRGLDGKTIRHLLRAGRMEPKYGFKIWVQTLKSLRDAYADGRPYGFISPDNIVIDAQNNISLLLKRPSVAYIAPERTRGTEPDLHADIFSMGVVLYEMLTGGLDGLGTARVTDSVHDVPDWLDEIVITCLRKVRDDRYRTIEDILEAIRNLSRSRREPGSGLSS